MTQIPLQQDEHVVDILEDNFVCLFQMNHQRGGVCERFREITGIEGAMDHDHCMVW